MLYFTRTLLMGPHVPNLKRCLRTMIFIMTGEVKQIGQLTLRELINDSFKAYANWWGNPHARRPT